MRGGVRIGLISNSHRCLASFQSHFELEGLIAGAVSSSEHGLMKPHPSIFRAALDLVNVPAERAVMVGDSVRQDVDGALAAGMRAVLVHRSPRPHPPRTSSQPEASRSSDRCWSCADALTPALDSSAESAVAQGP